MKQQTMQENKRHAPDPTIIPKSGAKKKKKRNILIHPDHIEDLDKTYAELEKHKVEVHDTGYTSSLHLINRPSHWNGLRKALSVLLMHIGFPKDFIEPIYRRRILLHGSFVRKKLPTRTAFIFTSKCSKEEAKEFDCKQNVYIQGCPVHYLQRTSVFHIKPRFLGWFRWWGYYADLDMTPEPQSILIATNRSPMLRSYTYHLVEQNGRDQNLNDVFDYRFVP